MRCAWIGTDLCPRYKCTLCWRDIVWSLVCLARYAICCVSAGYVSATRKLICVNNQLWYTSCNVMYRFVLLPVMDSLQVQGAIFFLSHCAPSSCTSWPHHAPLAITSTVASLASLAQLARTTLAVSKFPAAWLAPPAHFRVVDALQVSLAAEF